MGKEKLTTLEAINLDHENSVKHFKELLCTKTITFAQFAHLIDESQKMYNSLIEKIEDENNTIKKEEIIPYYQSNGETIDNSRNSYF
jgi:predicted patatin/cPLA2 family phospholipase